MPSKNQVIYLVRHAQTSADQARIIGHTDVELSTKGKKMIAKLEKSWNTDAPKKIYCSDLIRARESAEIINKHWQLEIEEHMALRELDFGLWETKLWDEVYNNDADFFNHWAEHWRTEPTPMGECFEDVVNRCRDWLDALKTSNSPIVIVAHAGSLRAITSILLDLPASCVFNFEFSHACVSKIQLTEESARLDYLNNDLFK